jgi:hypothetical protein
MQSFPRDATIPKNFSVKLSKANQKVSCITMFQVPGAHPDLRDSFHNSLILACKFSEISKYLQELSGSDDGHIAMRRSQEIPPEV